MPAHSHVMPTRLILLAAIGGGLLMSGCAKHQDTRATHGTTTTSSVTTTRAPAKSSTTASTSTTVPESGLPEKTGIAACDDYLSSYLACHRAAAIYAPDQLQSRYEAMRTSLLRDSRNPDIRPQLANRCNSLSSQLRQALHGKSCAASPASASSTP